MDTHHTEPSYTNLVLKGGGVKSYAYVGSIHVLEEKGVLSSIENVSGSSAGALYASLIGLNYSADEIENFILNTNLNEEVKHATPEEVNNRFFTQYGNYTGDYFINSFNQFIEKKFGTSELTFQKLHDLKDSLGLKDIYLTGVDVSEGKPVVFSYKDTPDMKLSDAIRISCGYPLMYTPVKGDDGHYYVDGGLLNNYPVNVFNSEYENAHDLANPKTLGLYLGSHSANENGLGTNEIASLLNNISNKFRGADPEHINQYISQLDFSKINDGINQPINDVVSFIAHLFSVYSQVEYHEYQGLNEITIDGKGFNALDLDIGQDAIHQLINNGTEAAENYLNHTQLYSHNADYMF